MREYFIDGIPYISKEQFCKLAHVRKANALKLIQSGLIPYIDIGDQTHRYLIRQSDAEAYLTDRAHDPAKYSFQRESRIQTYPGKFDRNFANELSQYASVLWKDEPQMLTVQQVHDLLGYSEHELLTINALAAADYCIIPVQAHFLASEGIPDVLEMVKNVQNRFNPDLKIAGILLTMYQSRPQLCQSVRNSVNDIYGESLHVFERPIEQTIKAAECPAAGMSILDYAPKNPAAESYRSLALEVLHLA